MSDATYVDGLPADVYARCQALKARYQRRDVETGKVRAVRRGDFEAVAPGSFTEDFPAPIIANRIDTMARDMAAVLTPLPTFSCPPSSILKDRAKKFADKRTKIVHHYVESSNLQGQMPDGADSYHASGMFVAEVRPDFKNKQPKIKLLDGAQSYPVWDSDFNTKEILIVSRMSEHALSAYYPDAYVKIRKEYPGCFVQSEVEVWTFQDEKGTWVYLPAAENMMLSYLPNKMNRCTYVAVPRPMGEDWYAVPRGAFADLIYPMIAANDFRMLQLEATEKAVRAPLVVPSDVPDVPFGPDATIHTNNPQGVGRLKIDVPGEAFQASEILDRDMQVGAMAPGGRSGNINASVITGRGIEALGQGYSEQVAQAQTRIGIGLQKAISIALEMDEKFWPNAQKEIRGQSPDNIGVETYIPSKDISGDYTVTVDYGFLLGLDANRALVFILQAQGAGLISNDTAARNLPIKLNLAEEANRIQLEQLRQSLLGSVAALAQAIPAMIQGGQSPSEALTQFSSVVSGVKKGEPIEDVIAKVFAPPPPPPAAAQMPGPDQMGQGAPGGMPPGMPGGMPGGGGQAAPAGPPDLAQLIAGLSGSGAPNLSARVSRQMPAMGG